MIDDEYDEGYKPTFEDEQVIDEKGRIRWRRNMELADHLRRLRDYLIIGGYPETRAIQHCRLVLEISRLDESVALLEKEGRLKRLRGVGPELSSMITEFLRTGTTSKYERWKQETPESVLDLLDVPGIGVKTARTLYLTYAIKDITDLRRAFDDGTLRSIRGIGPKTIGGIQRYFEEHHL